MTTHGRSILERLWDELMHEVGEQFAMIREAETPGQHNPQEMANQRGVCFGLAKAIAIMTNPYSPDIEAVRQEAMERYGRKVHSQD